MSAAALGMMSSGWVWLVCDDSVTSLAVVPSFGPGTMLVRSRQHRHPESIALDVGPRTGQTPYNILGEALSSKGAFPDPFPKARQQPSSSPQQFGPMSSNMPRSRTFYSSAPHRSPLPTTSLAYDSLSSKPRFSQTSLPWAELEPLSKSNGSTSLSTHRSMNVQRYSTGRSGDGSATSSGLLQDDRLVDSAQSRTLRNLGAEFARNRPNSLRSTSVRIRGVEDDMCPLMCISVHEHMWMAGGYGVWGKEEYLRRLWPVVNWKKISAILELWRSQGPAKS
ncbi:hypothetical protein FRC17_006306 [Serendipita sp. 399]|nr:hypothetical protein FRC17_006306 [Serendipita sp. 399]